MELVEILKSLWRSRAWVVVGAVLAVAAAIAAGTRGQTTQGGTASAEILIDARESALGDLRRETLPLVARSAIFARFLGADGATDAIAREAGLPTEEIAVLGPKLLIDGVPDQASAERAIELSDEADYLIQVQQGDDLPLLTIFTQAPTKEGASGLANSTAAALERYVSKYQERAAIPERRRVTIRQLGSARSGDFKESPSAILPFAVFLAIFGLSCLAILAWPSITAAWRSPEPSSRPAPESNGGPTSARRLSAASLLDALQRWRPAAMAEERPRCRQTTKAGRPCKNRAMAGSDVCRSHSGAAAVAQGRPYDHARQDVAATAKPTSGE